MELAYLAAFGCALCYGIGSLLQDLAAKRVAAEAASQPSTDGSGFPPGDDAGATVVDARSMVRVTTRLPYLFGIGLDGLGWGLSLLALMRIPLFAVEAIAAGSIGVVVVGARVTDGVRPNRRQWLMLTGLTAGLVSLAVTAQPANATRVSTAFDVAMWVGVGVTGLVAWRVMLRLTGDAAAGVLGALSGVAFGGTAICARALEADHGVMTVLTDPLAWAVLAYGPLGLVLFAGALQRGTVTVALSSQFATQTVVPALVGLLVLGDRSRPGQAPLAVAGFVVTTLAAVGLAWVTPARTASEATETSPARRGI